MKKYSKFFAILLAVAMILPGVAQTAQAADVDNVVRLGGKSRIETSIEVSKVAYPTGAKEVVLAGWNGEPDALTGTILANAKDAPVLFTHPTVMKSELVQELDRLNAEKVYVLGGESVVSKGIVTALEAKDLEVVRIAGGNRSETAVKAAQESGKATTHVFLANGFGNLADALAAGPASATESMPILLTEKDRVPASTLAAMKALGVTHVTILGEVGAVSEAVETELSDYTVDRVGGTNRERTAVAIADKYFADYTKALVANGYGSPDALVGGYLGAKIDAPILLTQATKINPASIEALTNADKAWILGQKDVVSEVVENEVIAAVEGKVEEELKVESVSAINAKTLEVKFNKAVVEEDQAKAVIEAKRGSIKPSVKEVKFAEDMMSATIEFNAAMIAGDYTVTVSGLTDEALTGTVKVEAEKLTKIEFLSDVAVLSGTGNSTKISTSLVAKNQYGEEVNAKLTTASVSSSKGTPQSITNKGLLVVDGDAQNIFKVDDKVVLTVVDSSTGVVTTKTVTVVKAANVDSIELGELKTDNEELAKKPINVTNMTSNATDYYVPVVIKDQYGNVLKAADLTGAVNVLSSNDKIIKVATTAIVDLPKVGTVIKLQTPDATATHGTVVLTVVAAGTGKTASVTLNVLENAKIDVLTVSTPEKALKEGVKTELPFSAIDQYGNDLVSKAQLAITDTAGAEVAKINFTDGSSITATGATLSYSVDYGNKENVKLFVTPSAKNVVLTAVSKTGKAQTLNLTAEEAPEAASLGGLSKELFTTMQVGQSEEINYTDIIVKDQYGETFDVTTNAYKFKFAPADLTLDSVKLQSAATAGSPVTELQKSVTEKLYAQAVAKGTEAVEISLIRVSDSKELDKITVNFEAVELKDITEFGLKNVGKIYTGTSPKNGNSLADYDKVLEIFGKKGNKDVKVDEALLLSATATAPIVATRTGIAQSANQIVTNGVDKVSTLTAVIDGANNPITVTQQLTYNDAPSVQKVLKVRETAGNKLEITNGAVVVPVASIDGKLIGPVGANSTFQFYAEDQYGVVAKELSYTVTNLKSSNAAITKVAVADDGTITVTETTTTAGLAAGDTFTITAIVDGLVKSIKVIVGA